LPGRARKPNHRQRLRHGGSTRYPAAESGRRLTRPGRWRAAALAPGCRCAAPRCCARNHHHQTGHRRQHHRESTHSGQPDGWVFLDKNRRDIGESQSGAQSLPAFFDRRAATAAAEYGTCGSRGCTATAPTAARSVRGTPMGHPSGGQRYHPAAAGTAATPPGKGEPHGLPRLLRQT
jgi:hypothetical protein